MYNQKYVVVIIVLLAALSWAADNTNIILQQPDAITIPKMLNYQGKLVNLSGSPVTDSIYSITFKLYTSSSGGASFWNETQSVQTASGLFTVLIGSVSFIESIPQAGNCYLEMQVNPNFAMAPRIRITSSAYAYLAKKADTANYALSAPLTRPITPPITTAEIADSTITSEKIQDNTIVRSDVVNNFKAPYSDTADFARVVPVADSVRIAVNAYNAYKLQGKDTSALDIRYVNEAQNNSVTTSMITDGTIIRNDVTPIFKSPYSDTADYARVSPVADSVRIAVNAYNAYKLQGKDTIALDGRYINESQNNSIISSMITDGTIIRNDVIPVFKSPYSDTADYARVSPVADSVRIAVNAYNAHKIQGKDTTDFDNRYVNIEEVNSITSTMIQNNTIDSLDIKNGAVINSKLISNAVSTDKILDGTIGTVDIEDEAITNDKIERNAVTTNQICDSTIIRADVNKNFKSPFSDTADYARSIPPVGIIDSARVSINAYNSYKLQEKDTIALSAKFIDEGQNSGGDLTGTYPNPSITGNAVTTGKILNNTILREDVATNFKAPYADTSDFSRAVNIQYVDSARIVVNSYNAYKLQGKDTIALSVQFVDEGQINAISNAMIANDAVVSSNIQDGTIQIEDLSFTPATRPLSPSIAGSEIAKPCTLEANISIPLKNRQSGNSAVLNVKNSGEGDAIKIIEAGEDGLYIEYAENNGVSINRVEENGINIYRADGFGVYIDSVASDAFNVSTANNGLYITRANSNGVYIDHANFDGVYIDSAGAYGINANGEQGGIFGQSATGYGVRAHSTTGTALKVEGPSQFSGQITSSVSDGKAAPIIVSSPTVCPNLNADLLDGQNASDFLNTASDYGRSGVTTDLYEGTTTLTNKYVNEGQNNAISTAMITDTNITMAKIQRKGATTGQILKWNGTTWSPANDSIGSNGTVTSVGLSMPTQFAISGSPVTTTGTLTASWVNQSSNAVLAGPSADKAAAPSFRSLVAADIPSLPASQISSGIMPIARGGTNSSTALSNNCIMVSNGGAMTEAPALSNGQLLIGSTGSAPVATNLIAGSGISVTNGAGSITIASTILGGPFLPLAGGTMTGPITNTGDPTIKMGKGNFGTGNTNTGAQAFVTGSNNVASGDYSTVGGGYCNNAYGYFSVIGGGGNIARSDTNSAGDYSFIGGGYANNAQSMASTISGGHNNTAGGGEVDAATVGGGMNNNATSSYATVSGGEYNNAYGSCATIGGGNSNYASSNATVAGGINNVAYNSYATVGGGICDSAKTQYSTVGGGYYNTAGGLSGGGATISGGYFNKTYGDYSTISGGAYNKIEVGSDYATIGGGQSNSAYNYSIVGGGNNNNASGQNAAICGGNRNYASGTYSTIGGGYADTTLANFGGISSGYRNKAGDAVEDTGAVVCGGRENKVTGKYSSIGGGQLNVVSSNYATISCGYADTTMGNYSGVLSGYKNKAGDAVEDTSAVICGGKENKVTGKYSAIGGGQLNVVTGNYATIGGGYADTVSGHYATAHEGRANKASGNYSSASGYRAKAIHSGAFVWADSTNADFSSQRVNQYRIRANGGVKFNVNDSGWVDIFDNDTNLISTSTGADLTLYGYWTYGGRDLETKENFILVDRKRLLEKLSRMPITMWNNKGEKGAKHIGPTAQDFYTAFGLGVDGNSITSIDPDGVALAAIQELYKKYQEVDELRSQIEQLRKEINNLKESK